jgi:hypothetical protein
VAGQLPDLDLGGLPVRLLTGYRPGLIATALGLRPVAEQQAGHDAPAGLAQPLAEALAA